MDRMGQQAPEKQEVGPRKHASRESSLQMSEVIEGSGGGARNPVSEVSTRNLEERQPRRMALITSGLEGDRIARGECIAHCAAGALDFAPEITESQSSSGSDHRSCRDGCLTFSSGD